MTRWIDNLLIIVNILWFLIFNTNCIIYNQRQCRFLEIQINLFHSGRINWKAHLCNEPQSDPTTGDSADITSVCCHRTNQHRTVAVFVVLILLTRWHEVWRPQSISRQHPDPRTAPLHSICTSALYSDSTN